VPAAGARRERGHHENPAAQIHRGGNSRRITARALVHRRRVGLA
jgi:hypothetical protein